MNMSYCKMENTNLALQQCMDDLLATLQANSLDSEEGVLSEDELHGAIDILRNAAKLAKAMREEWGDDFLDKDEDALMEEIYCNTKNAHATAAEHIREEEEGS